MYPPEIEVEDKLKSLKVKLKSDLIEGVVVKPSPRGRLMSLAKEALGEVLPGDGEILSLKNVKALRRLYWSIGIDPTKTRPSSEALLRRALKGSFPAINNLVDAGNLASLRTQVPIGIYDMDTIRGPLRLTWSRGGERFSPIGGREMVLEKGVIILVDSEKVIHLFPHRDSILTAVRDDTRRALIVACGTEGIEEEELKRALTLTREYLEYLI